jgi:hypothetical protein
VAVSARTGAGRGAAAGFWAAVALAHPIAAAIITARRIQWVISAY